MGSAPGWPRAGGGRFSPAGGRRVASSSPSRFRRSTGVPDGFGAPAASPPARARVGHSPLPHPWPAPPVRASGHDLDGQLNGPATDGTDRSQISVVRGGPQSFARAGCGRSGARRSNSGSPRGIWSSRPGARPTPPASRRCSRRCSRGAIPFSVPGDRCWRCSGCPAAPSLCSSADTSGAFLPRCRRAAGSPRPAPSTPSRRSPATARSRAPGWPLAVSSAVIRFIRVGSILSPDAVN